MILEPVIAKANLIEKLASYDWDAAESFSNKMILIALCYVMVRYVLFIVHNLIFDRKGDFVFGKHAPNISGRGSLSESNAVELVMWNCYLSYVYRTSDGEICGEKCLTLFGQEHIFNYSKEDLKLEVVWPTAWWILFVPAPIGFVLIALYVVLIRLGLPVPSEFLQICGAAFLTWFWYLGPCLGVISFLEGHYKYDPSRLRANE